MITRFNELYASGADFLVGTDTELDSVHVNGKPTARVAFGSPSSASIVGDRVAVSSSSGELALLAWPSLDRIRWWATKLIITTARLRPDGKIIATVGDRHLRLWDPVGGRMLADVELPVILTQLAWSPDGSRLAVAGASGTVWLWDLTPRDHAGLGAYVKCVSPWRLEDTAIVAAPFDPASCAMLGK
jgi:WD40 repeat protein